MPDINEIYAGDRLKAEDLKMPDGRYGQVQGVIERADVVELRQTREENSPMVKKIELHLVGKEKTVIVNKTNAQNIAMLLGTNTDNWLGATIGISVQATQMGPGIRLDVLSPPGSQPLVQQPGAPAIPPVEQTAMGPPDAVGVDDVQPVGEPGFDEDDIPF